MRRTLQTANLQLCLLFFRELRLDDWFWESGSGVAHPRRDQGLLWSWALNVWTTHLYYKHRKDIEHELKILPMDIFLSVRNRVNRTQEWQLNERLSDLYPHGISKQDILATLDHLYSPGKLNRKRQDYPPFLHLVSEKGIPSEDRRMLRRLITDVEDEAIDFSPYKMEELVDAVDKAFQMLIGSVPLTSPERTYLQLHLLVSHHNILFDVSADVFHQITGINPPQHEAMLSVSAMDNFLTLDIAFYYLENGRYLEQTELHGNQPWDRLRCPLLTSSLPEKKYLLESDENIRCCLFNHPLAIRQYDGRHMLIALERVNCRFKPKRSRRDQRELF